MSATAPVTWLRLCPVDLTGEVAGTGPDGAPRVLAAIARVLAEPEVVAELRRGAIAHAYPEAVLARLRTAGVMSLLAEAPGETEAGRSQVTFLHLTALNALTAATDGALAITLGVTALGLLPTYAFATPAQQARTFARVRAGALAGLLLTELAHGSDLLACEMRAERVPGGGYRLWGEKDLINGGTRHPLLTVLARTRGAGGAGGAGRDFLERAGDLSVFVVDREATSGVHAKPRWHTLPMPGADIAGVRFEGAPVGEDTRLSDEGEGFTVVQRTLALSRGGVSGLASGIASHAARLARTHARERQLYGAPIARLGAIAEHTLRVAAADALCAALSVRQALYVDALGPGAAYYTACAKYACCALAEEAVEEGRRVLGGRALIAELPYAQLVRDVLLYGTFDGTPHVMLSELTRRLAAALEQDGPGAPPLTAPAPTRLVEVARRSARVLVFSLRARVAALAATAPAAAWLAPIAATLAAVSVALRRSTDQALLFAAADALARLEAIVALAELDRPAAAAEDPSWPTIVAYALASQATRVAQAADVLALRTGATPAPELRAALAALVGAADGARAAWQARPVDLW